MGGGVDFYMTERIALTVDATYVVTMGDIQESDDLALGWGVLFTF